MTLLLFEFVAASAICVGILMPLAIHARSIGYDAPGGVQKLHRVATSRLGGMVVVIGYFVVLGIAQRIGHAAALASTLPLALAALPVALVGLSEDLTGHVRPRIRMVAAVASAALASFYAGGVIPRLDLPLIDPLLKQPLIALPITWVTV